MTAALVRPSFSSSSAMVGLKGSSLLTRDRAAGVCAGASKYFLMVRQLPPARDCVRAIASSNPDAPRAIAGRCPGIPADTPDQWQPFADGNRYGVAADRPDHCKRPEQAETWMAEMNSGKSCRPVLPEPVLARRGDRQSLFRLFL
jgi:hypothetical protein